MMSLRCAVLVALAAVVRSQPSCAVRLINELATAGTLSVTGGAVLDSQPAGGVGGYVPLPCTTTSLSLTWPGALAPAVALISFNATSGGTASALASVPAANGLTVFADVAAAIPDGVGNIDSCSLRLMNAAGMAVVFDAVTAACTLSCAKAALSAPLASGTVADLGAVACDWPLRVDVSNGGATYYARDELITLDEHGAYTLLLTRGGSLRLLTDVAGRDPLIPLYVLPALLLALGALHALVGAMLACFARVAPPPSAAAGAAKEGGMLADALIFFGFDKRIKRATEAAEAAAAASATSQAQLSVSLLSTEAEAEAVPAAATAALAAAAATTTKPRSAGRVRAIDALRGICLTVMIWVNYGAGGYSFLDHAAWNGLHLADLLFPSFVFTQGLSMAISFDAMRRRGASQRDMASRVIWRALKLYALGCLLNGGADLRDWRLLGVLQYFAMSYLIVGCTEIFLRPSGESSAGKPQPQLAVNGEEGARSSSSSSDSIAASYAALAESSLGASLWRDVGRFWAQWLLFATLAAIYLGVQQGLPVDGCPTGYIGPGGAAEGGAHASCTGGAHRAVDIAIFGARHIYSRLDANGDPISAATCASVYGCAVYDPEGALGWLSAAAVTFLGLQVGRVLVTYRALIAGAATRGAAAQRAAHGAVVLRWLLAGIPLALLGGALAGFSQDGGIVPINKNLWSPSFVVVIAGIDCCALAALYALVDVAHAWSGAPFVYVGMNSIVTYAGHELFSDYLPFQFHVGTDYASHAEYLASNVIGVLCWVAIARILYLRKIFINL